MTKRKNKNFNKKPPFYWPLILLLIILIEIGVLIYERTWSQAYGSDVFVLGSQVEKINFENKLMFKQLFNIYNQVLHNSFYAQAERIYLVNPQLISGVQLNEKKY